MNIATTGRSAWARVFRLRYEAFWVFFGQFGVAAGTLFGVKILTQVLDPLEFGRLTLANTLILLVGINVFGPLGHGFMRFWSISVERGSVETFILTSNVLARRLTAVILGISVMVFFFSVFSRWCDWPALISTAIFVGALTGYFGLRLAVFLAARKRKTVAFVNSGTAFLKPLIAVLFVSVLNPNARSALWGYLVAACVMTGVVELFYRKLSDTVSQKRMLPVESKTEIHRLRRDILSFAWPFCAWGMVVWVYQSCDKWSVLSFHGADVVGEFSVTALLAFYPLVFASGFLINLFMPIAYERAGDLYSPEAIRSANRCLLTMTGCYVLSALFLVIIFVIFNNVLILLISNSKYVTFSHLLPGLAASWALFYLGEMLTGFGLIAKRPKVYLFPKLISGTIAAGGTFYLSARIGVSGVAWGLGIAGFVYALWCMIVAFRFTNSGCAVKAA